MKALRKGVSPVVATLLLILIAVAAAVLLYTWVSGLSANVAGSKVTGKTLTLIQATWAMAFASGTATNPAPGDFDVNSAVLILSFKAPPAAVGSAGAGQVGVTFDNADVLYGGRVICHYSSWALSTDDKFHIGQDVGGATAYGLFFQGYSGANEGVYDAGYDLQTPGGIIAEETKGNTVPGASNTTTTASTLINPINIPASDSFATVVAGVWQVSYVATRYVETSFKNTTAVIRFDRFANSYLNRNTDGSLTTSSAPGTDPIPLFDMVKVSQDDFAVVIWCKNINMNVMNSVDVRLQFKDGSTWTTTVPLGVQ